MSQIKVNNLTFSYDTNYENIFENVSFEIDTDWKLGFIGRNGRGKTTFPTMIFVEHDYIFNKNIATKILEFYNYKHFYCKKFLFLHILY